MTGCLDFQVEQAKGSNGAANINLGKEFSEILSPGGYGMVN
jgi:hypothetical protein